MLAEDREVRGEETLPKEFRDGPWFRRLNIQSKRFGILFLEDVVQEGEEGAWEHSEELVFPLLFFH